MVFSAILFAVITKRFVVNFKQKVYSYSDVSAVPYSFPVMIEENRSYFNDKIFEEKSKRNLVYDRGRYNFSPG
jgi:hypothetical protein